MNCHKKTHPFWGWADYEQRHHNFESYAVNVAMTDA